MSTPSLKLLSSMATRELLAELAERSARELSQRVVAEAAGGVDIAKRVEAGEAVDIVALAANAIDKLIGSGKLLGGSRVDLVKSGIGMATRKGGARYDVGSEEAVKAAVLNARSISYSTGPSGTYLQQLFERWGILGTVQNRIVVAPPGIPVGALVAKGECELGFQQMSELINLDGIEVLGPLPPSIQMLTVFSGGISSNSPAPDAARRVLEFMASPGVADVKRRFGMEPA
ncbi:MAG TPA: substrate-binding domain-containing protein [Terriglobia bacterium]|nr:substrate-binding domain-containing protein [Terriglobia bacterium]